MLITRAYKTELALNNEQVTACRQHAGAARWANHWGLRRIPDAYKAPGKSPTAIDLHRELNVLKQTEIPWMYAMSQCAPQEALRTLDTPSPTSSVGGSSSVKANGVGSSAIPGSRPRSADWAVSGSPAPSRYFLMRFTCPG